LRSRRFLLYSPPTCGWQGTYLRVDAEDEGATTGTTPGNVRLASRSTSRCNRWPPRAATATEGSGGFGATAGRADAALGRGGAHRPTTRSSAPLNITIGEQAVALARLQFERATRRVQLGEAVLNDQLRADSWAVRIRARRLRSTSRRPRGGARSPAWSGSRPRRPPPLPADHGRRRVARREARAAGASRSRRRLAWRPRRRALREKKGRFLPSLALTRVGETGEEYRTGLVWSAGVVLDLPISTAGRRRTSCASPFALEQERLRAEATSRDISARVARSASRDRGRTLNCRELRLGSPAAVENLASRRPAYEVGLADSL